MSNRKIVAAIICGENDVAMVREEFDKRIATNGIMLMAARVSVTSTNQEEDEFFQRTCFAPLTKKPRRTVTWNHLAEWQRLLQPMDGWDVVYDQELLDRIMWWERGGFAQYRTGILGALNTYPLPEKAEVA